MLCIALQLIIIFMLKFLQGTTLSEAIMKRKEGNIQPKPKRVLKVEYK